MVKAAAMLRVAAHTCGRREVNEFDALLLQHCLWQRPDEAPRIRDWLLERVAADIGTQQARCAHTRAHTCCTQPTSLGSIRALPPPLA